MLWWNKLLCLHRAFIVVFSWLLKSGTDNNSATSIRLGLWSEEIELRCSFSFIKAILWVFLIVCYCILQYWCSESEEQLHSVPSVLSGEEQRWVSTFIIMSHYCIFDHFFTEISYWMWWPSVLYSSTATHFHIISVSIFWCNCTFIAFVKLLILLSLYRHRFWANPLSLLG